MREDHLLSVIARAISQEQAQKAVEAVMAEYGGEIHAIPTGHWGRLRSRNREIRALYQRGDLDILSIATRYGLSETQVRRIVGD